MHDPGLGDPLVELKIRASKIRSAELRKEWGDFSAVRKQSVFSSLMKEILIHPAQRPFNRFQRDRMEIL